MSPWRDVTLNSCRASCVVMLLVVLNIANFSWWIELQNRAAAPGNLNGPS